MNGVQFLKSIGDARAFRQTASLVEREISRLRVTDGDLSQVGGASGWPSHSVWESLKTASHFNLAIALELRLKCLLLLEGAEPPHGQDGHPTACSARAGAPLKPSWNACSGRRRMRIRSPWSHS